MHSLISTMDADEASAVEAAKAAIVPVLAAHGIASVVIDDNGYGDEGQFETITAFDAAGVERPIREAAYPRHESRFRYGVILTDGTLAQALVALGYEVLAAYFAGWKDNEGSLGSSGSRPTAFPAPCRATVARSCRGAPPCPTSASTSRASSPVPRAPPSTRRGGGSYCRTAACSHPGWRWRSVRIATSASTN